MKFVNFKDLYEMVVNYFEGLEDDEIMLAFMHHNKRDPMLKRFDSYLTVGTHEKAERKGGNFLWAPPHGKENRVVYHGDGCLWDSVKRPNAEQHRPDGLSADITLIDDTVLTDDLVKIAKCRRDGWCACHSDPYRKNEESTHSEKEVEEKPLKDEKETKTNDEKISSLEKFGLATNWASAMTMINARDFLQEVSNALRDMNEKLKQEVKLEPAEEPKKDILKVKCTKGCTYYLCGNSMFTTGKVYERVNGVLVDDAGLEWVEMCKSDNPAEWESAKARFELYEEPKQEPVEEPKKDILKVKCTYATGSEFIEGKVYDRVNGVLMSEHGFDYWALCKDNDPSKWSFIGFFSGNPFYKFELCEEPKEEPKQDILKVRCVGKESPTKYPPQTLSQLFSICFTSGFTVGKIYQRVNGVLTDDAGYKWMANCCGDDPTKWTIDGVKFELYEEPKKPEQRSGRYPWGTEVRRYKCTNKKYFCDYFTVGKVYEVVNGVLTDDEGDEWDCDDVDPSKWDFDVDFELCPNNLKVKCVWISNPVSESWTVGKVYKRVDGVLFDDAGYEWGNHMCNGDDPTKWGFRAARFELAE